MQQNGSDLDSSGATPFPSTYQFGLNSIVSSNSSSPSELTAPSNICTSDPTCLQGANSAYAIQNECCNDSFGMVLSGQYLDSSQITSYCTAMNILATGCYPCSANYTPVVQETNYNAANPLGSQYITFYECLPTAVTVGFSVTATTFCNPGADIIDYTLYSSTGSVLTTGSFISGDNSSIQMLDGEYMVVNAHADCCCPDAVHHQNVPTLTLTQQDIINETINNPTMYNGVIPSVTLSFTGSPHCHDDRCENGTIALTVVYTAK